MTLMRQSKSARKNLRGCDMCTRTTFIEGRGIGEPIFQIVAVVCPLAPVCDQNRETCRLREKWEDDEWWQDVYRDRLHGSMGKN